MYGSPCSPQKAKHGNPPDFHPILPPRFPEIAWSIRNRLFSAFGEEAPSVRLRRLTFLILVPYIGAEIYFSAIPFLSHVPRALFEAVRIMLFVALASSITFGSALIARGRKALDFRAWWWFAAALLAGVLCGWTLVQMSFPWMAH